MNTNKEKDTATANETSPVLVRHYKNIGVLSMEAHLNPKPAPLSERDLASERFQLERAILLHLFRKAQPAQAAHMVLDLLNDDAFIEAASKALKASAKALEVTGIEGICEVITDRPLPERVRDIVSALSFITTIGLPVTTQEEDK